MLTLWDMLSSKLIKIHVEYSEGWLAEFIFSPPEKLSIRILVTTHRPLYIHPQELNTDEAFAAVWRVYCRDISFRTKFYISLPCFGRQSARIDLATPTQFPRLSLPVAVRRQLSCRELPVVLVLIISGLLLRPLIITESVQALELPAAE
jgi:hypothetical protein